MASGIKVHDEVKEVYKLIGIRSAKAESYQYAVFNYSTDGKFIVVDQKVKSTEQEEFDYDTIIQTLPKDQARFLAYNFPHGDKNSTVILISWCPESCTVRQKLIQGTSVNGLKLALSGSKISFVEADTLSDITESAIRDRFKW